MFEIRPNTFEFDLPDRPNRADPAMFLQRAISLFNASRWTATIMEIKNFLFCLDRSLLDLSQIPAHQIRSRHYDGIMPP
jgi:hypothetical protein